MPHNSRRLRPAPNGLAYIVFTSGSTGTPKGVMTEHAGLTNVIQASIRSFGLRPGMRVLQHAALSFDNAIWEVFMALAAGAVAMPQTSNEDVIFTDLSSNPGEVSVRRRVLLAPVAALALLASAACAGKSAGPAQPPPKVNENNVNTMARDNVQDGGKLTWPIGQIPDNFNINQLLIYIMRLD